MDRDQASNTLAWRWVARLHTKGRPYIARAPNISKFTNGRFFPTDQLVADVKPLCGTAEHLRMPMPNAVTPAQIDGDYVLQIKEEDMLRTCAAACACGNDWGFGDSWKITIAHRRGGARIFSRCYARDVCGKKLQIKTHGRMRLLLLATTIRSQLSLQATRPWVRLQQPFPSGNLTCVLQVFIFNRYAENTLQPLGPMR